MIAAPYLLYFNVVRSGISINMRFKICDYNPERHRQGVLRLLGEHSYKIKIWAWQFELGNCDSGILPVVAEDNEGNVIGFNGIMPVDVSECGNNSRAIWSCDFVVDEMWRGIGVGKEIKKRLHQRCQRIMSLGISDMAVPVLEKSGWFPGSKVSSLRRYNGWAFGYRLLLRPWQWWIAACNQINKDSWGGDISISEVLPSGAEIDALWLKVSSGYERIVSRDSNYVIWRYGRFPLGAYEFHEARLCGELQGVLVCRTQKQQSFLVDYIGPCRSLALKRALFSSWYISNRGAVHYAMTTSDSEWKAIALSFGFRITEEQRFYIHDSCKRHDNWTVMMGDSDGEFLAHARHTVRSAGQGQDAYTISQASAHQFGKMKKEWDDLLNTSDANPLFSSWAWLYVWWDTWAEDLKLRLRLYLVHDYEHRLVAIAPMFLSPADASGVKSCALHFIGTAQGISPTVRTELNSFIFSTRNAGVLNLIFDFLNDSHWREWYFPDIKEDSRFYQELIGYIKKRGWIRASYHREDTYIISTQQPFINYLSKLGSSTRLRLFNRRKLLLASGKVDFSDYGGRMGDFVSLLNEFHVPRWGKACFDEKAKSFHERMANEFGIDKISASVIKVDGEPISVLYDIHAGGCVYNIQQGYKIFSIPKVSLGTLHMGYALERYCRDKSINSYNLLAGQGRNSDYKRSLASDREPIVSLVVVRSCRHLLKRLIRQVLRKSMRLLKRGK